jgi:hypothetical protein
MNYNINSSGLYDLNSYNLIANNATILSSLTVNGSTLATNTNLNNLSTSSTLSINNLNNTSTTIFNNLNSLSTSSTLSINNLNNTSTTIFNNLNSISTSSTLSINNLNNTSTTIFNNLNSLSTYSKLNIDNLNATSTTLLSYINNLTNPSTLTTNNLNVSGTTKLNNSTTLLSSLNVSGTTKLNNFTTINSSLYINTNQATTTSALSINSTSSSVLVNIVQNAVWNDGVNYALNVSGYSIFGGVQINGQDTNNIYKRIGDLTIASPSTSSIILKTNYGNWEAMRLNTVGTSINTSLYVSGTTTFNNNITINSVLSVKNDIWHKSVDNIDRIYYSESGTSFFHSGSSTAGGSGFVFRSYAQSDILTIGNDGALSIAGTTYANGENLNFPSTLNQYKINLYGTNIYGFGIAGGTLMYSSQTYHKFYNSTNNNNTFSIDSSGNVSCTGSIFVGSNNSYPNIQLGSTNGHNIAIATTTGSFSSSAIAGDLVLRSLNRVVLQSGSGGYGLIIDSNNNTYCSGALSINNTVFFKNNVWNNSSEGFQRLYFAEAGTTYFQGYGTTYAIAHEFRNNDGVAKIQMYNSGDTTIYGQLICNFLYYCKY